MTNLSTLFPIHQDATAQQWDVKSGKTAYIPAGKVTGNGYFPGMMKFDGSTGFYNRLDVTTAGNIVGHASLFNCAPKAGVSQNILRVTGPNITGLQCGVMVFASDSADTGARNKLRFFANSSSAFLVDVISSVEVANSEDHYVVVTFNTATAALSLRIDGIAHDDVTWTNRVPPITGTLNTGANCAVSVGTSGGGSQLFDGSIGQLGFANASINWSNFMHPDGTPKPLDETIWTQWGGVQPLFWHEAGKMDENKGSAGAMTKNGTITLASALA